MKTHIYTSESRTWVYIRERRKRRLLLLRSTSAALPMFPVVTTAIAMCLLALAACAIPRGQKGGTASTLISRGGQTNAATLAQSENPKEASKQTVQSEQTLEYVLPAGTAIDLSDASAMGRYGRGTKGSRDGKTTHQADMREFARLDKPVPVRLTAKDRTETSIGGAQKDTLREWAGKAAAMQPVMWAGIAMMTLVAGVLIYFGWWTKAAVALGVGLAMVILAHTLPDHGTIILFGGLGIFAAAALLVLYAYHKGLLDRNQNGIPDILEKGDREVKV